MRKIALALGIVLLLAAGQSFAQRHEISGFGTWNSLSGNGGTRDHVRAATVVTGTDIIVPSSAR